MIRDTLNERLPDSVTLGYGTLYISTDRGLEYMDALADWKHIDRVSDIGIISFLLLMVSSIGILLYTAISTIQSPPEPTAAQDPVNMLAIPGVNDFLPIAATAYIIIALFVAAGVHEFAHGVMMRAAGVTVEEVGIVLLLGFPIAAYVLPDEEEFKTVGARDRARALSAGVFANLLVFAVTTLMFALPGVGSPINAFVMYFGSVYGSGLPSGGAVASIGIVTNTLFWTWFFNINLAFVNTLPVAVLDGGRLAELLPDVVDVPWGVERDTAKIAALAVTTTSTLGIFGIAVFGPLFL